MQHISKDALCVVSMDSITVHERISLRLLKHGPFSYRTIAFIWQKNKANMGNVSQISQNVSCVVKIFKKGNISLNRAASEISVSSYRAQAVPRHSDKPDEVRHRITEMFPTQSKIELFARVNDRLFPPMEVVRRLGLGK